MWCVVCVCVYETGAKPLCAVATKGISPLPETQGRYMVMDSEGMLSVHMFGDVQAFEQEIANPWHPLSNYDGYVNGVFVGNDFDDILLAETLLAESRGIYGFNRELSGTDAYADLITLIENHYGDWAFRVLDRYTVQALWSLADEFGAHNALEFIQSQDDENI